MRCVVGATPVIVATAQHAVELAQFNSVHLVFEISIAFAAVAILAALCTKSIDAKR